VRWYADDSDIRTIKDLRVPNLILFGGIAVSSENERLLRSAIEEAKSKFGHKRLPIKWNFKDLKKKYSEQNRLEDYEKLLSKMFDLRKAIFDATSKIEYSIIISIVIGHSSDSKILQKLKSDLSRHVFSNSLMRFSQHVKETNPQRAEVILDWPDSANSKPFDIEYACAYNSGETKDGQKYMSGPLESLNFHDSAVYTRMPHCTLMQFSDLILGATREFVQHALDDRKTGHGVKLLNDVAPNFRGFPNHVIGRGININSGAPNKTKQLIANKFNELYINKK